MAQAHQIAIALLLAVGQAAADEPKPEAQVEQLAVKTGKERLGRKWSDEQRVDNCKVPEDQRGTKPRSDTCPSEATQ